MFHSIGELFLLFVSAMRALPHSWRQRRKILEQLFEIGNASLLMTCVLALFMGGVIALETGPVLVERGLSSTVGGLVGFSICKQIAPVMISILMAGRIGSAMSAEIGSMRVYQEIDALRTMNINPVHYLVLPRFVAIVIAVPVLVLFADLVGWAGGALVASTNDHIAISFGSYFDSLRRNVDSGDVIHGLFKSLIFGTVVGVVSCHQGLETIGGPRGIGRSVTKAVVNSIVIILLLDYALTRLLMIIDPP